MANADKYDEIRLTALFQHNPAEIRKYYDRLNLNFSQAERFISITRVILL